MEDSHSPHHLLGPSGNRMKLREEGALPVPLRAIEVSAGPRAAEPEDASPGQVLWRRKGTIVLAAILCAVAGFFVSLLFSPLYQAHTSLEIQGLNENFLNMRDVDPTASAGSFSTETYLETQVKILQSESLIDRVVAKLGLEGRPEFTYRPGPLAGVSRALRLPSNAKVRPREYARNKALDNLKVRPVRRSRLVEILYDSTDPNLAAQFANTLAREFIQQNLEIRWSTTQSTGEWLTRQLEDLKVKLEQSEGRLQEYALASGLLFTSEKDSVAEAKLQQLQQELSKAQADRVARQSQYETAASSPAESLPEVLDNGPLREYQIKLADLRRQFVELRASYKPTHYRVKELQAQINELESIVQKDRANIIERIHNEYESALRREKLLTTAYASQAQLVSAQAAKAIHYNVLKREVDSNRQLYEAMLQKVKEAGIASAARASNIRVVDLASAPANPYKPNPILNAALGMLSGISLGVLFALARERIHRIRQSADHSLRAPGDASAYLGVPELGAIPKCDPEPVESRSNPRRLRLTLNWSGNGKRAGGHDCSERVELITWQQQSCPLAESFRAALTSILATSPNGSPPPVMVVTSPEAGEGKTTAVSNLGIALAEINRRVLLIDGNMRSPRLHEIFDVENHRGLSDALRELNSVEECARAGLVQETRVPRLHVVCGGSNPAGISNLLYSPRLAELLSLFRRQFDAVLIDTPPMRQLSDARVVARLGDGVILVVCAGETTREAALAASQRLAEDGIPLLGTILNQWNQSAAGYGYPNGRASYPSGGNGSLARG